jgi:multicomponent Na+:H+ antiporter subunit G
MSLLFSILLALVGAFFFMAGTVGLLRFPDTYSRLHALTKADNLGLGLIVLSLALYAGSIAIAVKLFAIWLLAMLAGTTNCYLMGRNTLKSDEIELERAP